jgi:hypothetical protein
MLRTADKCLDVSGKGSPEMDYETLDTVADLYVPFLAVLCGVVIGKRAWSHDWGKAKMAILFFIYGLVVTYGLMLLDDWFELWPKAGLDYSTHTAIAICLAAVLMFLVQSLSWLLGLSLVGYGLLMLYQNYHTVADILTTSIAVCIFIFPMSYALWSRHVAANQAPQDDR